MEIKLLISAFVAILALITPVHKILVISSLQDQFSAKDLKYLSTRSSLTALFILISFLFLGHFIFT